MIFMRESLMVIAKLNEKRVFDALNIIGVFYEKLKKLQKLDRVEFLADERNPAAAESFLRRAVEAIFDVGRHILSKGFAFKSLEYKEVVQTLGEKGIVDKNYAQVLIKMAGYRNRMVHFYKEIKPEELYDILQNHLEDLLRFLDEIRRFLKKTQKPL